MGEGKMLALIGAAILLFYSFCPAPPEGGEEKTLSARTADRHAANEAVPTREAQAVTPLDAPASAQEEGEESFLAPSQADMAVAMTIGSAAMIKNEENEG